jgi:ribosomal protein S18 acetylase RimI-like enzyme
LNPTDDHSPAITYRNDVRPDAADVAALYAAALLIRPTTDLQRIAQMLADTNVVLTAWDGDRLVALLRGWTDGAFDGYVCDLAVDPRYQNQRIGRELLERLKAWGPQVQWVVRASKIATGYYEHLGWQKIENGWFQPREPWE